MKKRVSLVLIASLFSVSAVIAVPNYSYQGNSQNPQYSQSYYPAPITNSYNNTLKGRVVTVPTGQILPGFVPTPISSEYTSIGQSVCLSLGSDFCYNGNMIAPAGSTVMGTVIEVSKAKKGNINGRLCIRFNQIITPYGLQIPISAIIKTEDNSGVLVGGTKTDVAREYVKDAAVGAGTGALTGLVAGAIAGGSIGKATAIMTGIGAGTGVVRSAFDKGNDVVIPAGATVDLVLTQPVTAIPSSYDYEN